MGAELQKAEARKLASTVTIAEKDKLGHANQDDAKQEGSTVLVVSWSRNMETQNTPCQIQRFKQRVRSLEAFA